MKKFKDRDIQLLLGQVLRAGTVISITIVLFGGIIYLYNHGGANANYRVFIGIPDFIRHFNDLICNTFILKGQAIIQVGIILLIATPIIRVICSAIGFVLEKDYMYLGISLLVLFIIFISMISGHAG
ncbi:MAG TPA: DUF1634 domain-containing protein [Mucilaginibacter sp.]